MFGTKSSKTFIKIHSDGTIRQRCSENDPDAVRRDYELPTGGKGTVFEKVYSYVEGYIAGIEYQEGQFGTQIMVDIHGTNGDACTLTIGSESRFAEPFLEKLPNIDPKEIVRIQPFSYEKDGKNRCGVTVTQDDERIESAFKTYNAETKQFSYLLGYPAPEAAEKMNKDKWKLYFQQTRIWLRDYLEENVLKNFNHVMETATTGESAPADDDTINLDSIPF